MKDEPNGAITELLQHWAQGDRNALDAVIPAVYAELQRLARQQLRRERPDHTLRSAALVNEAYLRFLGLNPPRWESRTHFFAIAAQLMRQILVDHARRHRAAKRGGEFCRVSLEDDAGAKLGKADMDVLALDDALHALAKIDPRQSQVVELRFFGGLSLAEISDALKISPATVERDWRIARAWLHREISRTGRA